MKKMIIFMLIVVVLSLSGCTENNGSEINENNQGIINLTYEQIIEDLMKNGPDTMLFQEAAGLVSYDENDDVYIKDVISNVSFYSDEYPITFIFFDIEDSLYSDYSLIPIALLGNYTLHFQVGETVSIPANLTKYDIFDDPVVWPQGWYDWYVYVSGIIPVAPESVDVDIQRMNDIDDTLIVTRSEIGLRWSNFTISGTCDTSELGEFVTAGDRITDCSGEIIIRYNPNSQLIGYWEFE
jgi:hypothetical protein